MSSTEGPHGRRRMCDCAELAYPDTYRDLRGSSTDGPSGRGHMLRGRTRFGTPRTLRGCIGSSTGSL
eukprot:5348597-Pyramimonas_sp.AAC.1